MSLLPAGERQAEVIEPMVKRGTSDAYAELHRIGEIRQSLLTRRMLLTKDHLPLRAMQRLPVADPPLQRASQIVGKARMPALHLQQQGNRTQSRRGPQHWYDLAVPILRQWIRPSPPTWRPLLRRHLCVSIKPSTSAGAETRFCCGGLTGVGSTEVHVQLRLLISDVFAGHRGSLLGS